MAAEPERGCALRRACRAHVEYLRDHRLCDLPSAPLEPGVAAPALPVDAREAAELVSLAARQAAVAGGGGIFGDDLGRDEGLPRAVVWTAGPHELLVLLDELSVRTGDGVVSVFVDVACDELRAATRSPRAHIQIDFVVGTEQRPTGMLAVATPPQGPHLVVDRWGAALVAFAWQALLDSAAALTASAGRDTDGAGLLPTSWTASPQGIAVGPRARHEIDRRITTAVRR